MYCSQRMFCAERGFFGPLASTKTRPCNKITCEPKAEFNLRAIGVEISIAMTRVPHDRRPCSGGHSYGARYLRSEQTCFSILSLRNNDVPGSTKCTFCGPIYGRLHAVRIWSTRLLLTISPSIQVLSPGAVGHEVQHFRILNFLRRVEFDDARLLGDLRACTRAKPL